MEIRTPEELEQHLSDLSAMLTEPAPGECVLCSTERMLAAFGCDCTLRWARRWRDLRLLRLRGPHERLDAA